MGRSLPILKNSTMAKRTFSITESDFEYEHFPVVCPTCEGKGEICEDENGLVTFVPVKDKRLKPAWTKLKVGLFLLVLLVAGGLTTFFLYPRDVEVHVSAHNIINFNFQSPVPWMEYSFDMNIKNNNFFRVKVRDIKMNLQFMKLSIAKKSIGTISVGVRGEVKKTVTMNATYADATSKKYLRKQCYVERQYVGQLMQTFGELDYWSHSEHIKSRDDYFYTDCGSLVFPLVVKTTKHPTTTSTTTITTTSTTSKTSTKTSTTTKMSSNTSTTMPTVQTTTTTTTKPRSKSTGIMTTPVTNTAK